MIAGTNDSIKGDYFNLGGVEPLPLENFVKVLLSVTGTGSYRIVPFPSQKRAIDIGSVYTSFAKFNSVTGWMPRVSLEDGLARTVDYYRRYQAHYW